MSYDVLAQELKTLPEEYLSEIMQFVVYLKLKEKFSDYNNKTLSYEKALSSWRDESKTLFDNDDDASFMETAFDFNRRNEIYAAREIW